MAKKSIQGKQDPLVWVMGDNGRELVPKSQTVEIPIVPFVPNPLGGDGMLPVPATVRVLFRSNPPIPQKLVRIDMADRTKRRPWCLVTWKCRKYAVSTLAGKRYRDEHSCYVRNEADVNDPLFITLTRRERKEICDAVRKSNREAGA
jgi:hypothetical protein